METLTMTRRIKIDSQMEPINFTIGDAEFTAFPHNKYMGEVQVKSTIDRWDGFVQFVPVDRPVLIKVNADGVAFDY